MRPSSSRIATLHSLSETIVAPPPGRARLIASLFIGAYLLWQISVPFTYYLGREKNDERFSWRMFSVLGWSQKRCAVTVTETIMSPDQVPVPPQDLELVIGNFVTLLTKNRAAVVEKFLRSRCNARYRVVRAHLARICLAADGSEIPSGSMQLNCLTGALKGTLESR